MAADVSVQENAGGIREFGDLVHLLEQDGVPFEADPTTQSLVVPTELGPLSGEMVLRWESDSRLLQCLQTLPFVIPEARLSAVESAVARINHALLLPGFGLSHAESVVYFRLVVPRRPDGTMIAAEIQRLFRTTIETARDFFPALRAVALDDGRPEEVLAAARANVIAP